MTTKLPYIPRQDYVIVEPFFESDRSPEGSIIIPKEAQKKLPEGRIVATGPECSSDLTLGRIVVWQSQAEYVIDIDGTQVVWVKESAIMMIRVTEPNIEKPSKNLFPQETPHNPQFGKSYGVHSD